MRFRFIVSCLLSGLLVVPACWGATPWRALAPGLQYATLSFSRGIGTGQLHAFKIDLKRYRLVVSMAKDMRRTFGSVGSLTIDREGLVGINGGFFTPQMQPLGLRISNGHVRNPVKRISWWGVLQVRGSKAELVSAKAYRNNSAIQFAIQSGPRLVINGRVPTLKGGVDRRSALGISRDGDLVIAATQRLPMTTTELANIMRKPTEQDGLNCRDALNLDGGSSTQLYASVDDFYLSVPSYAPITDAVVVVPR